MDQISVSSVIFASWPEAFVVILLGILSIGKYKYLENKLNYIKMIGAGLVLAVLSYFVRRFVSNVGENVLIYLLELCLLLIFIMRLKFYESIMASLFGIIILFIAQTACAVLMFPLMKLNLSAVYINDNVSRILATIPERIIEIGLIYYALRSKIKIFDLESTTVKRKEYFIQISVYIISIGTLIFLAIIMGKFILLGDTQNMNATNTLLLRLNIYLSLFVTVILTLAIRNTHEFYKNKSTLNNNEFLQNLDYISNLIEEKNYVEAKGVVDSLKDHIVNQ